MIMVPWARNMIRMVLKTGRIVMNGRGSDLLADPEIQKAYIGERWRKR